jgi:hypothetical protein
MGSLDELIDELNPSPGSLGSLGGVRLDGGPPYIWKDVMGTLRENGPLWEGVGG